MDWGVLEQGSSSVMGACIRIGFRERSVLSLQSFYLDTLNVVIWYDLAAIIS